MDLNDQAIAQLLEEKEILANLLRKEEAKNKTLENKVSELSKENTLLHHAKYSLMSENSDYRKEIEAFKASQDRLIAASKTKKVEESKPLAITSFIKNKINEAKEMVLIDNSNPLKGEPVRIYA